ncbi:hypothetical protein SO802_018363 [Lithocarpus litseifolius]|uniref:Uncharacterized protein n=1 Tax=Lithocarpus litseifolius TaxID=425828 RepID=A0AAW2CQD4_9ROSI
MLILSPLPSPYIYPQSSTSKLISFTRIGSVLCFALLRLSSFFITIPAAKFREKGLENVDLLDIMFKDIATMGYLAWAPTSSVLLDDIETPKEGLGDTSADSSSPNDDDDVPEDETHNLT